MVRKTRKSEAKPKDGDKAAVEAKRLWLRSLIDKLPSRDLEHACRYVEFLVASSTTDPVLRSVLLAPEDDEPETPEERAAVAKAKEDIKAGRFYTLEEVKRELDL